MEQEVQYTHTQDTRFDLFDLKGKYLWLKSKFEK